VASLSLAYITKNEEFYIARSIRSALEIADEIIVVDSQSSDDTRKICRSLGAKVWWRKWRDDFSYMKNVMLSKCSCDWVLTLDADEHLEGEPIGLIREAMALADTTNLAGYQLPRKNHYPQHDSDSPYFTHPFFPDLQLRLFRRLEGVYYTGRVHEGVMQSIEAGEFGGVGIVPVTIHHHMFRGNKEKYEKEKGEYYALLGEKS